MLPQLLFLLLQPLHFFPQCALLLPQRRRVLQLFPFQEGPHLQMESFHLPEQTIRLLFTYFSCLLPALGIEQGFKNFAFVPGARTQKFQEFPLRQNHNLRKLLPGHPKKLLGSLADFLFTAAFLQSPCLFLPAVIGMAVPQLAPSFPRTICTDSSRQKRYRSPPSQKTNSTRVGEASGASALRISEKLRRPPVAWQYSAKHMASRMVVFPRRSGR